jgi:hypothetical protein
MDANLGCERLNIVAGPPTDKGRDLKHARRQSAASQLCAKSIINPTG